MKVEFYKSVLGRDHHSAMEIEDIRNYMLTDKDLKENTMKYRELYQNSGLICMDIDHLKVEYKKFIVYLRMIAKLK